MSQENVEVVRTLTAEPGDLHGRLEVMAAEIELHLSGVFPDCAGVPRP